MSPIYVEFGNSNAIEGYRDPASDDPELVRYRPLEGDQVTTVVFPEGYSLSDAYADAVATINHHFAVADESTGERHKPSWVESDSPGLKALLSEQFGLDPAHKRPKTWGKESGAQEAPSLAANLFADGEDKGADQ